jgi:hypothetical protein
MSKRINNKRTNNTMAKRKKNKRTNNTMAKIKITKGQTTQWPKEKNKKRTDNTMAKIKITKGQTTQWPIVLSVLLLFFLWPLCCLSFCSFSFGHCVVCPFVIFSLWPKEKVQTTIYKTSHRKLKIE